MRNALRYQTINPFRPYSIAPLSKPALLKVFFLVGFAYLLFFLIIKLLL